MSEIINKLFKADLDQIIQTIFLNLDPLSLKNCRCVSPVWSHFIQQRLWNSKPARQKLERRSINQWKFSKPFTTEYSIGIRGVSSIACDDDLIVCGYSRGQARVYQVSTGELKYELRCQSPPSWRSDDVQVDLGKNVIATVTENGTVSVWNKTDGALLYQDTHHGEHFSVFGIKVTDEFVITGAGDGSVIILESIEGKWKIKQKMFENTECVTHIDVDGKWAVAGTRNSIKLWNLEEHQMVENVKPVKVKGWMLSFIHPHAFVVGGNDFNGVQIWDMEKCVQIRHVLDDMQPFHKIDTNGHFVTVSEYNELSTADGSDRSAVVVVFDAAELIDTKLATKDLWKKCFDYSPATISAVATKTSLVVYHDKTISIMNFWKDRIILSRLFEPPPKRIYTESESSSEEEEEEEEDEEEEEEEEEDEKEN